MLKATILGVAALASLASAVPASAVITTFAAFTPADADRNVRWVNGTNKTTSSNSGNSSSSGFFYTIASPTANAPGIADVKFEFLQLPALGMLDADFFMDVTVTSTPAQVLSGIYIQQVMTGGFSFKSKTGFSIGMNNYAAGTNLLSGTYTNAAIVGTSSSGSFSGNNTNPGSLLSFTSDVLGFTGVADTDFSMSLTSLTPAFFRLSNVTALRSFRAVAGGQFSTDPAPESPIPEPEVWALLVVGFGLIGVQARRRARRMSIAA